MIVFFCVVLLSSLIGLTFALNSVLSLSVCGTVRVCYCVILTMTVTMSLHSDDGDNDSEEDSAHHVH
jgi:hypothetical protein